MTVRARLVLNPLRRGVALGCLIATGLAFMGRAEAQRVNLADLSLEELGALRITTVSRRPEPLADAPAAIYVITHDAIRRAGFTTFPEALRLAPNLQVARLDNAQYAISARGFNNNVGNKLLVMIDGRTVYTPVYSGVFWEQQDLLLDDIERIEVISGPGATLWGANAVNGVINVITRSARDTVGFSGRLAGGNRERIAELRHGDTIGSDGAYRVYAKIARFNPSSNASGAHVFDAWDRSQVGARTDWERGESRLTLQADWYEGEADDRGLIAGIDFGSVAVAGANVLGRWTRRFAASELQLQAYVDHMEHDDLFAFRAKADTFDVELQHAFAVGKHDFIVGGGHRRASVWSAPAFLTAFVPDERSLDWQNLFAQDVLSLGHDVEVTLGLKVERNDYTDTESLPNLRVAWRPGEDRMLWTSVARAVRAPSRFDRDVRGLGLFPPPFLLGGPNFVSEVAEVVELGYRAQPVATVSFDATLFRHTWDKLRSGSGVTVPITLENYILGTVEGLEAWAVWRIKPSWQLRGGLWALDKNLRFRPGTADTVGVNNETLANDPDFQWQLQATGDITARDLDLDVRVRRVGDLVNPAVPDYLAVDASVGWELGPTVTLRATVQNVFDARHAEYGSAGPRAERERVFVLEVSRRVSE